VTILSSSADLRSLLSRAKTIAVVGLSANAGRDSHRVAAYLQAHGYRILAVNPNHSWILGERSYANLEDVPEEERRRVDIVNVFRRPEAAAQVAREAARLKVPAIWFQLGVATPEALVEADRAGMAVVADRCIQVAHQLLFR